jgi:2-amino-4-hydroxy-6-hydroxymethyldihydropteridine diphosphokinase
MSLKGLPAAEHLFAVSLGSNLGDRAANLSFGLRRIKLSAEDVRVSPLYETRPLELEDQPDFLNACCIGRTRLTARQLLSQLQDAERAAGRRRSTLRYGPRRLDLDLLLYDEEVILTPELEVPHPRMRERAFVIVPLADIALDWVVPASRGNRETTVGEILRDMDTEGVRASSESPRRVGLDEPG